jgi:TetR/AcrR family transcriptional regulator
MTRVNGNSGKRQEILEALANMLHAAPGGKITTAALARELGVSEAALYRHFPSKARMLEGLLDFTEETLFSRIRMILDEMPGAADRLQQIVALVLVFAERNPGIAVLLGGDALAGETARLRERVRQLHDRLETQFRQILREAELREGLRLALTPSATAELVQALVEGKLRQFVRSDFARQPMAHWAEQWQALAPALFVPAGQTLPTGRLSVP